MGNVQKKVLKKVYANHVQMVIILKPMKLFIRQVLRNVIKILLIIIFIKKIRSMKDAILLVKNVMVMEKKISITVKLVILIIPLLFQKIITDIKVKIVIKNVIIIIILMKANIHVQIHQNVLLNINI